MTRREQVTCRCSRYTFPHRYTLECETRAQAEGYANVRHMMDAEAIERNYQRRTEYLKALHNAKRS